MGWIGYISGWNSIETLCYLRVGVKANVIFFDRKASEKPWTKKLWIYDLRTIKHFTLKTNSLKYDDLKDFIQCYNQKNRHKRKDVAGRDKVSQKWSFKNEPPG